MDVSNLQKREARLVEIKTSVQTALAKADTTHIRHIVDLLDAELSDLRTSMADEQQEPIKDDDAKPAPKARKAKAAA